MKSMDLYHGTDSKTAHSLYNNPLSLDVTKGGGELGQGFYLGEDISLAVIWAKGRYKNPGVLEFEIDKQKYSKLSLKHLLHKQIVRDWVTNRGKGIHRTHTYGFDVVLGSLATLPNKYQYKFESKKSELLLQKSPINKIL